MTTTTTTLLTTITNYDNRTSQSQTTSEYTPWAIKYVPLCFLP